MLIKLNGINYEFSDESEIIPKSSSYDLKLVEPDYDEKTQKFHAGGVDSNLDLPWSIEQRISRTSLLPVAKIFKDAKGNKKLSAYFD